MLQGGCLCGQIRYEYDGALEEIAMCHCKQCQKAQGTPFIAIGLIRTAGFTITQGEHLLKAYHSSPNKARVFCAECGSPLYSMRDDLPAVKRLRVGTLDVPTACDTLYHIFYSEKVDWIKLADDYPKYCEFKND